MSDNIPFDIQTEIIKRVSDVKSLIRFRLVSKPWKSFIQSSKFIACYGIRHSQPHRLLLRYNKNADPSEVKYLSFLDDVSFPQNQQDFARNVSDLVKQLKYSKVIGSSYGLWCFHGYNSSEMLVIWNPSIRKSVAIVLPFVLRNILDYNTQFGFGVCPSTYDPTIVKISYSYTPLEGKDTYEWQVEIFTVSSKTWKTITSSNFPRESIRIRWQTQVSIDRFIYWSAYDDLLNYNNLILSFDLITHGFKEVNFAASITNQVASDFSISKLNESLVVSAYAFADEGNIVYGIWVMGEEGGVMTSFTKLFTIKTHGESVCNVLGFTMNGEPIMETEMDYKEFPKVQIYKRCSEQIDDIGIEGEYGSFFIRPYAETLLLVDHSDCYIISNDS